MNKYLLISCLVLASCSQYPAELIKAQCGSTPVLMMRAREK